jgi:membrane-associated protein
MVEVLTVLGPGTIIQLLFLLMLVDGAVLLGLLVPGDLLLVAASSTVGWPRALVAGGAAFIALLAAHLGSFLLGRHTAGRIRTSRLGRRIGFARWCRAEQVLRVGGDWALVATPFLPVVNTVLPVLAGSLGLGWRRFLVLAAVGDLLWVGLWTATGAGAGLLATDGIAGLVEPLVVSLVVGVAAGAVFGLVLHRAHLSCGPPPAVPRSVILPAPDGPAQN